MIFDTHAHYDAEQFEGDREPLLEQMHQEGVEFIVNIGASIETSKNTLALTRKYPFIYGALGVHPDETKELDEDKFTWLQNALNESKIVAVGEIGLDYYWDSSDRETQKYWFARQMELAREAALPMVIHSREAAKDTLDMIKAARGGEIGGVIHCYAYSTEIAREYLQMGFYLGIGGVVTFANAKKLKEVVAYVPLESLVLETDCPYLAPVPYRGKRNQSSYLIHVAEMIAELKGITAKEVIQVTNENAKRMYRIQEVSDRETNR